MLLDVKHRKSFRLCLTGIWYGIRFRTLIHLKRQYKKLACGVYLSLSIFSELLLEWGNYKTRCSGQTQSGRQQRCFMDYGVCDDYKQILEQYTYLHDPVAKYVIVLHKITKKHNSSWRWHKNGPYIGTQNHRCEYIGDEPEVEQVYSFQIFHIVD